MSRGAVKSAFNTVIFQAKVEVRKNQDLCEPSVNRKPGGCWKNSQHPLVTEKVVHTSLNCPQCLSHLTLVPALERALALIPRESGSFWRVCNRKVA